MEIRGYVKIRKSEIKFLQQKEIILVLNEKGLTSWWCKDRIWRKKILHGR